MTFKDFDNKYSDEGLGFTKPLTFQPSNTKILDSGSFGLNIAHGIGGIRTAGLMRVMGAPGLGKTSLSCRIVADGLANGMPALYIDTERGLNLDILRDSIADAGLDPDDPNLPMRYAPATSMTEFKKGAKPIMTLQRIFPMCQDLMLASPNGCIIVFDSLDMIVPEEIVGESFEKPTIALTAKHFKNFLRLMQGTIVGTGSLIIVVSQVSANITTGRTFETETFSGGNALRHASILDIRLKDIGQLLDGTELVGRKVKYMITKSKNGRSWRTGEYQIRWDTGPDRVGEVIDIATALKVIEGKTWATIPLADGTTTRVNGRERIRDLLMNDLASLRHVEKLVLDKISVSGDNEVSVEMTEDEQMEMGE